MDERKHRALAFFYQSEMQYLWAIHTLEMAHYEWMRREKTKTMISLVKIIAGTVIALASVLAGAGYLLTII